MSFEDIAGNEYAKEIINETFVLPTLMPKVFKGKARPWQSILLYGVIILLHNLASWRRKDYVDLSCLLSFEGHLLLGFASGHHF